MGWGWFLDSHCYLGGKDEDLYVTIAEAVEQTFEEDLCIDKICVGEMFTLHDMIPGELLDESDVERLRKEGVLEPLKIVEMVSVRYSEKNFEQEWSASLGPSAWEGWADSPNTTAGVLEWARNHIVLDIDEYCEGRGHPLPIELRGGEWRPFGEDLRLCPELVKKWKLQPAKAVVDFSVDPKCPGWTWWVDKGRTGISGSAPSLHKAMKFAEKHCRVGVSMWQRKAQRYNKRRRRQDVR